jgi:hypothetical protein
MHGRHEKVKAHHWAGAVVAVLVVVSLAFALRWVNDRGSDHTTTPASSSGSASAAAQSRQLHACRTVWGAQSAALDAAGRSLEQWRIHVDAMNRLVAGEITLAQAQAFWNRTRQGAAARVARFEDAAGRYADVAPDCARSSSPRSHPLAACVAGVQARARAIEAGRIAITTWKHHIMDMNMLRAGQITPQQATTMWLRNWRRGVAQLDTFSKVRDRAARAGSCA